MWSTELQGRWPGRWFVLLIMNRKTLCLLSWNALEDRLDEITVSQPWGFYRLMFSSGWHRGSYRGRQIFSHPCFVPHYWANSWNHQSWWHRYHDDWTSRSQESNHYNTTGNYRLKLFYSCSNFFNRDQKWCRFVSGKVNLFIYLVNYSNLLIHTILIHILIFTVGATISFFENRINDAIY